MLGKLEILAALLVSALCLCIPALPGAADDYDFIPLRKLSLQRDSVTLRFIGDVMLHKGQIDRDFTPFLKGISEDLAEADVAFANMEFSLGGRPYTGYPAFSSPDSYAEYVVGCGVDVLLTANNHILDRGLTGLARTLGIYGNMERMQLASYCGSGLDAESYSSHNPLCFRVKGIKIAVVNCTYGTNVKAVGEYPKVTLLEEAAALVSQAREEGADFVIALPHWGPEYKTVCSGSQREAARRLAESGADIIIGSHPHVVQNRETIDLGDRQVPVFYSLGNAVSNMSAENTRIELMLTLKLVRGTDGSVSMLEPQWDWLWCSLPGRLTDNYATIRIEDYRDRRELWMNPRDYDLMISSLERVREATGLY